RSKICRPWARVPNVKAYPPKIIPEKERLALVNGQHLAEVKAFSLEPASAVKAEAVAANPTEPKLVIESTPQSSPKLNSSYCAERPLKMSAGDFEKTFRSCSTGGKWNGGMPGSFKYSVGQ